MSADAGPLAPLHGALSQAQRDLGNRWQQICSGVQHHCQEAGSNITRAVQHLQRIAVQHERQHPLARLASLSAAHSKRKQPAFELAFNPLDVKARLSGVPVFTVANKNNSEFVLVSGMAENSSEPRQLGLFFFNEGDAVAMVEKIEEQNPELAKQSQVMRLTLDKVYEFAITPKKGTPAEGVIFRFMPDAEQVKHALQLFKEAGIRGRSFTGVPVFQAEGLTVKTDKTRYTPLFFSKEDLDAAVGNAYAQREQHKEATNKAHSDRASAELADAQSKLEKAAGEEQEEAQVALDKAKAKLDKYKGRVEDKQLAEKPKVEVGSLEEVLVKMQSADGEGEWGSVMFVPAGAISVPSK